VYLSSFCADLHQIWFGGRHLEFSSFGHISVANDDIFIKFGTLIDIGHIRVTMAQYIPPLIKLKMAAAAILNLHFYAISR